MRTDLPFIQGIKIMIFIRMFLHLHDIVIHKNVSNNKKSNVKWIKTLKTVFLSSEFWFRILCQLKKLNISIGKINKVNLQGKSKAWITHLLTEMSSSSPLKWERNLSWGFVVEKLKLSQDLLKSFTTLRRGGHWVSPGQPTTAQMNKSSGHRFLFLHPFLQQTLSPNEILCLVSLPTLNLYPDWDIA